MARVWVTAGEITAAIRGAYSEAMRDSGVLSARETVEDVSATLHPGRPGALQ